MDVGVIGTGVMGRNHARNYADMKEVDSVCLYDVNHAAASEVAKTYDLTAVDSLDELLATVDAVSLCVPTQFHFQTALEIVKQNVPLLIEKPICLSTEQGQKLIEEIPDGLTVGVGHIERFNPIIEEIARIVHNPLYVEIKRHNPASARVTGSSVVEDLMIHDIDIIFNSLFSGDYSLSCAGTYDICGALFNFGDVPVYLSASRKASKKVRSIYVEEEELTVEGDFMAQEVYVYRKPGKYALSEERYVQENIIEKVMVNKREPLREELSLFLRAAREGRPFVITPEQGLSNLRICEEIKEQCTL